MRIDEAGISEISKRILEEAIEGIPAVLARLESRELLLPADSSEGCSFGPDGLELANELDRENEQTASRYLCLATT